VTYGADSTAPRRENPAGRSRGAAAVRQMVLEDDPCVVWTRSLDC
jgi:hypothetical protein